MNQILLSTKWQLTRWGQWYRSLHFHHPVKSNIAEDFPLLSCERVEKINDLLETLANKKPQWVKAIKIYYILQDKNSSDKVNLSGFPRRTYYHYVNKAEQWLSERLT